MQTMSKIKALKFLETLITPAPKDGAPRDEVETWARNVRVVTETVFGKGAEQSREMSVLVKDILQDPDRLFIDLDERCKRITALLHSFLFEISELWSDEGAEEPIEYLKEAGNTEEETVDTQSKNVFLVHGHDHGQMQAVARFLEHIGLNPVILHERASAGATIIEKLEAHAKVAFAVVLLTPDDVGSVASDMQNLRPRARQNVVLELGYFLGRLGRRRTCALLVEGVEIPSDYSGVLYIPVDRGDAWKFRLAQELKAAGLPIDLNKLA